MKTLVVSSATVAVIFSSQLMAQDAHSDLSPTLSGGMLMTNGYVDATSTFVPGVRVFGYEMGEIPESPYEISDPGLNSPATSGLTSGWRVGVQLRNTLKFWDGSGGVAFSAPTSGEAIQLRFGSTQRTASESAFDPAGFVFGSAVSGSGAFHQHLTTWLLGSDANTTPAVDNFDSGFWGAGDGIQAADGIYLVQARLLIDNDSTLDAGTIYSPDFWIVYNNGMPEEAHGESITWVENNLVPEPASLGLIGLSALALGRRHRR